MIHISLQSEYIVSFMGAKITNSFITSLFVTLLFGLYAYFLSFIYRSNKRVVMLVKMLLEKILSLIDAVTNNRKFSKKVFPVCVTFFIFIAGTNILALLPGFLGAAYIKSSQGRIPILKSPNSDLTTTLALAIVAVAMVQFFSFQDLGGKAYIQRFFNITGPVQFIVGFFDLISEAAKVVSFSFRLFGNVFAGEVLLLIIGFLVPFVIPLPFMILELFVGFIQAFIFMILTVTFIRTGTIREFTKEKEVYNT